MITCRMKDFFFDRAAVLRAVDKAARAILAQAGAAIRLIARRSMRPARRMKLAELTDTERRAHQAAVHIARREGRPPPELPYVASKPGEPPRVRKGLLKRFLFYAWDPTARTVVVGPQALGRSRTPSVLEFGGQVTLKRRKGNRTVTIAERPYMAPALTKVAPRLPQRWRGALRGG